ncbi:unnamed protein product [Pleuronectes platessa]|uniref:MACPF domain-containing protein n=1 Tax=Pleuronectes platessa TaxID=8262 RepID=A0A9N7V275_PLEPL|nr:unnamed protein product [Pleuronectes platessa]
MKQTGTYAINVRAYLDDNHTCTLCPNRFQNGQIQKLPAAVLDWRPLSRCSKQLSSGLHHSVESLLRSSNSLVSNNWNVNLGLDNVVTAELGGSESELAKFANKQHSEGKTTFVTHELSCTFYSYRLADHPQLSTDFKKHLNRLSPSLNTSQDIVNYMRLIDTYGTHYIQQVQLGGKVKRITALRTCVAILNGYSEYEINNCLNSEVQMSLGLPSAKASFSYKCENFLKGRMSRSIGFYQAFMTRETEVIGGGKFISNILYQQDQSEAFRSWMNSLHDHPDVVSYAILPLHGLVEDPQISANLKSIVTLYITWHYMMDWHPPSKSCSPTHNLDRHCCPLRVGRGTFKLWNLRADGLNSDPFSRTDAYVKIRYHDHYQKADTIDNKNYPRSGLFTGGQLLPIHLPPFTKPLLVNVQATNTVMVMSDGDKSWLRVRQTKIWKLAKPEEIKGIVHQMDPEFSQMSGGEKAGIAFGVMGLMVLVVIGAVLVKRKRRGLPRLGMAKGYEEIRGEVGCDEAERETQQEDA